MMAYSSIKYISSGIFFILLLYALHNYAAKNHSLGTGIHPYNTLFIYSHGIANNHKQAYQYAHYYPLNDHEKERYVDYQAINPQKYAKNKHYIITAPYITFDYPDATDRFYRINVRKSGLSQSVDIDQLAQVVDRTLSQHQQKQLILFGISRGASTIINYLGQQEHAHRIQAIILESPFDTMEHVITHKIKQARLDKIPGLSKICHALVSGIFFKYHMHGIRPIDVISNIPKHLPILFICSQEDTLVPARSTINLYKKLKSQGYPYVHILIVPYGKHSHIIDGPSADVYESVAHAFLQYYHLPHDINRALQGSIHFVRTKPLTQELS